MHNPEKTEMVVDITKPISTMTADELQAARLQRLPVHCQTMCRRSLVEPNRVVYSDLEELTRENLEKKIAEYHQLGWRLSGTCFVRNSK